MFFFQLGITSDVFGIPSYQPSIWWIQKTTQAMDFLPMELLEWNLSMDDPIGVGMGPGHGIAVLICPTVWEKGGFLAKWLLYR